MKHREYDTEPGEKTGTVNVSVRGGCLLCEQPSGVKGVPVNGFIDWYTGRKQIQDALPEMSVGDREVLVSGTHDACFNEAFPPEGGGRTDELAMRIIAMRGPVTIIHG